MELAAQYEDWTSWIVSQCPPPDKFAHTYAGLTIWLLAALVMRCPLRAPAPILIVALAELGNETIDWLARADWTLDDALRDAAATLFWPLVLCLALSRSRTLRGSRSAPMLLRLPPPTAMPPLQPERRVSKMRTGERERTDTSLRPAYVRDDGDSGRGGSGEALVQPWPPSLGAQADRASRHDRIAMSALQRPQGAAPAGQEGVARRRSALHPPSML